MRHLATLLMGSVFAFSSVAAADNVYDLSGTPFTPAWSTLGTSTGIAEVNGDVPRSGMGSLNLETTGGNKAAATYGGNRFGGPNLGTFGDLLAGSLGFEFYRSSASTAADHLAPALEVSFNNGAILKWEAVYNGYPIASPVSEDTWYTIDLDHDTGLFWQYNGATVTNGGGAQLNLTLDDWLASAFGSDFTTSTQITGISVQAGSGWAGNFVGYADNVYMNFGNGGAAISANFEVVPLPAAAWAGFALFGVVACRRLIRLRP